MATWTSEVFRVVTVTIGILQQLRQLRQLLANMFSNPAPPARPPPHVLADMRPPSSRTSSARPLREESPEVIIRKARETMGIDCVNFYNFAVCGRSGVGKSSLINGILSLEGNDACPVGEVETTHKIKCCSNKNWPSLKIWDMPGAGTLDHPSSTYFEDKKLYAFDAILILSCDAFSELEFDIVRSAHNFGTPFVLVRTKCDLAVKNRAKREKVNALIASHRFRQDVSKNFYEGLRSAGLLGSSSADQAPQLFFISNEFFSSESEEEYAYAIYDHKTKSIDNSLQSMDEVKLITFLVDAAKRRA